MKPFTLSHIRGVVWDLDGTLYRYDQMFKDSCNLATARTVIEMGLDLSLEDALALATESEKQHGSSFKVFTTHGLKYEAFHHVFHDKIDAAILQKNHEIKAGLEALKIPMVILTNASRPWALRTVEHLEINHIFGDGMILCLEDMNYSGKGSSPMGFEKSLALMDVPAAQSLMVEDLPRNLIIAKQLGMSTALVHQAVPGETIDDYVDIVFEDTMDLIRTLAAN